jgi:hypothetical protein
MSVEQQYAQRTIRNVIARLAGRTAAQIVIGNHFDAWLLGGVDPYTGHRGYARAGALGPRCSRAPGNRAEASRSASQIPALLIDTGGHDGIR